MRQIMFAPCTSVVPPQCARDSKELTMKTYQCIVCGFILRQAQGLPPEGHCPGTKWGRRADTWVCPDCGDGQTDFEMVEILILSHPVIIIGSGGWLQRGP